MRYLALCTDYDGTIAHHGRVDEPTIAALEGLRDSGRRLLLVTGRELDDLQTVFDRARPLRARRRRERRAALPARDARRAAAGRAAAASGSSTSCSARGVEPHLGRAACIVATWEPHENDGARDDPRSRASSCR